jgi:hypothetical protein
MTIFDLLLIAVVLTVAAGFVIALIQAVTGHFRQAGRTWLVLVSGIAAYLAVVCIVSLAATQEIKALGEPDCSDDWCITPEKAHFRGSSVVIEFRVWSRAKRVTQREYGLNPFLVDEQGRRFTIAETTGPPFDQAIAPDEQFATVRSYRVPENVSTLDLVLRDGFGPDTFVIGASQSLLHPRTVYRIKPGLGPV